MRTVPLDVAVEVPEPPEPPDWLWAELELERVADRDARVTAWAGKTPASDAALDAAITAATTKRERANTLDAETREQWERQGRHGFVPGSFQAVAAERDADEAEARVRALRSLMTAAHESAPTPAPARVAVVRVVRSREHRARPSRRSRGSASASSSSSDDGPAAPPLLSPRLTRVRLSSALRPTHSEAGLVSGAVIA